MMGGHLEVWADGVRSQASAGAFIVIRGGRRTLLGLSQGPVRTLTLCSPPGFEGIFAAVAEQGEEELLANPDRLIALAAEYGTEILGDYPSE